MPVKLRLSRRGRKGLPYYYIVAADARAPRDGKFLDKIGAYDPVKDPAFIEVDHEKALQWLKNGAQPTQTVKNIFRYTGINLRYALHKQGKDPEVAQAMFEKWWAEKQSQVQSKKDSLAAKVAKEATESMARESKIRADKEAKIAAKYHVPAEETASEEAVEASAEGGEEVVEETKSALDEAKEELKKD